MKLYHSTKSHKVNDGLLTSTKFCPEYIHLFDYVSLQPIIPIEQPKFIVITSQRAVDWLLEQTTLFERLKDVPYYVVGETTRTKLFEVGVDIQGFNDRGIRGLVPILPSVNGWFIGAKSPVQRTQDWIDATSTTHIACYEQVAQPVRPMSFEVDSVFLLTSPNIVRMYNELGMEDSAEIIVLGQSSFEIAQELGYEKVRVSPHPNVTRTVQWLSSQF